MAVSVLVVDDEEQARRHVTLYLEKKGFTVRQASDGGRAMEEIKADLPDVVLLDIRMPVMTGLEVLHHIRKQGLSCEVIMMTGVNDVETAVNCMKGGAYGYLTKPLDLEKLAREADKAAAHRVEREEREKGEEADRARAEERERDLKLIRREIQKIRDNTLLT